MTMRIVLFSVNAPGRKRPEPLDASRVTGDGLEEEL